MFAFGLVAIQAASAGSAELTPKRPGTIPVPFGLLAAHERALANATPERALLQSLTGDNGWTEEGVVASDGQTEDTFGAAVAIDGTTALVGSPQPGSSGANVPPGTGAAYVFSKIDGQWTQTAKLTADDGADGDWFGAAVALEGNIAVVGAYEATVDGNGLEGAVYVFENDGGTWTQVQKLVASDGFAAALFGFSVALDGTTIVVGAYQQTVNDQAYQGAAYVFDESDGVWNQTAELLADDGQGSDVLGYAVAIHGHQIMVGAVGVNSDAGAVYVFDVSNGTWTQTQKLVADDAAPSSYFGAAISFDDTHALISAVFAGANFIGDVYAFSSDAGSWTQTQSIPPPDLIGSDIGYGFSVSIAGTQALVGYPGYDNGHGRADLFSFDDVAGWTLDQEFTHDDGNPNDLFPSYGNVVALEPDDFLVGAFQQYVGDSLYQGAAYFYSNDDAIFSSGFDH